MTKGQDVPFTAVNLAPGDGDAPSLEAVTSSLNAWIEIDVEALAANAKALAAAVAPAEVIAVVKANAYGAGAVHTTRALEAARVRKFAVAWVQEALELRQAGITAPIVVLGHANEAEAHAAVIDGITVSCDSIELGRALSAAAVEAGKEARVHIHVDTGLHRDGVSPREAVELANALLELPGIEVEGLSTHMANADEP